jgi:DNA-binding Lrp family transcriptional regulator
LDGIDMPTLPGTADPAGRLDDVDRSILAALEHEGRLTNAALAARVGIAESTCIARVRALRESGAITGFAAHIDPAAVGRPLQAVIYVRLGSHNRVHVADFHRTVRTIPGVLTAFHVAGADDYVLHVAVASPEALRDLVLEHVTVSPAVRHTETHLVFEVIPGPGLVEAPEPTHPPRRRARTTRT